MAGHALLTATALLAAVAPLPAAGQSEPDGLRHQRQEYPLNCRGGGGALVFDTIGPPSDANGAVALSLTFVASPTAAGLEGQGLRPGTCAWVDRPANDTEPRQIWFATTFGDSILRLTVRDSSQYWGFLAFNSDSGHLTGVGHRHWDAASPPMPPANLPSGSAAAASAPSKGNWLPFDRGNLPRLLLAWIVLSWIPFTMLTGVWSGWRRLAGLYPDRNAGRGRSFPSGIMVMGMAVYRGCGRLTADESHLHFSMSALVRPGHSPFSVPWSDITVSRDGWPWFPLKGNPVIRITLARHRGLRILVPVLTGDKIIAASQGRLQLSGLAVPTAVGTETSRDAGQSHRTSVRS